MDDDTVKAITGFVACLWEAADVAADAAEEEDDAYVPMLSHDHLVATLRAQFPQATREEIGEGISRGTLRNLGLNFRFQLEEIALETGIALTPHTSGIAFLEQAVATGNERAIELRLKMLGR